MEDCCMQARAQIVFCLLCLPCGAATVSKIVVTRTVDATSCAVPKAVASFDTASREAFLWFHAQRLASEDDLKVEWVAPDGTLALEAAYHDIPAASSLCFVTRLPIAGFAAASQPGDWTVRVVSRQKTLASAGFRITGETGAVRVTSVRRATSANGMELAIDGAGFGSESMVHIAQYTPSGGWRYVSAAQPRVATATQLVADHPALPAAEYLVIIRNSDGQTSRPFPFIIPVAGYKLPIVAGEPWVVTQGPYGTFSHWGRSLHAYDIAPRAGRCIVAMRAGVVHVHDVGARQDHAHRTFGNYITIDHGNGEYSHYAHLAAGTFVVREGEHVEQGQALAVVGNSGYTLGEGGGYHVHVHVTRSPSISAPSVPFVFEDLHGPLHSPAVVVSSNASPKCDCHVKSSGGAIAAATSAPSNTPQFTGHLGFSEWWNQLVFVPEHAANFDAKLAWPHAADGLELHLMSPSGHHYAWYADPTGYSGTSAGPQQFRIPNPEPGTWRVSVQAVRGGTDPIEFSVTTSGLKSQPRPNATLRRASYRR